ncbi:MAG: YHS domain-containing protein [Gammaproteobacteria bacterium]|nr:YHS domain-containing protein [Gammaproteobacteria bacterium]NIR84348.1 YHS domain-containing protein [Gammaproteobacteria bacterium]NIR89864.1 YHS domain-containing protein [Gammaproteobacteria bacterium]NIU05731.1 YHS domain-containing protein [Gammaproteobacteria bacterium]NIV52491.1 YHS domain-containing protein [Gammaproteobacteria bacterium]
MQGLLTFLVIAVLFYVMMRFGCGAHAVHGGHGGRKDAGGDVKHIDPVCGMEVPPDKGYGKMHEGKLYRFCSRNCLDKFEADPQKHLEPPKEDAA